MYDQKIKMLLSYVPVNVRKLISDELYNNFDEIIEDFDIDTKQKKDCSGYGVVSDYIIEFQRLDCLDCICYSGCKTYEKLINIKWAVKGAQLQKRKIRDDGYAEEIEYHFLNGLHYDFKSRMYKSSMYQALVTNQENAPYPLKSKKKRIEKINKKFLTNERF